MPAAAAVAQPLGLPDPGLLELFLLTLATVTFEVLVGRSAAFCLHPFAAWRRLPATGRVLLVGAYFGGSYVAVLAGLLIG